MSTLFRPTAIAGAQKAQAKWGPPACFGLVQFFIESSCGKAEPPGSNNGLGIQALPGLPWVESPSHEYIKGVYTPVTEKFAKFTDDDDMFDHWGRLLATANVAAYKLAMAHCGNWQDFVTYASKAYSTTSDYADVAIKLIDQYQLQQYNVTAKMNNGVAPPTHGGEAPALAVGGVLWVQRHLMTLDYDVGATGMDGRMGPATKAALKKFQEDHGLQEKDGVISDETTGALEMAAEKPAVEKK